MRRKPFKFWICSIISVLAVACTETPEDIVNTLTVTPDHALEFLAKDNEPVHLNVETDAAKWEYSTSEKWITVSAGEKSLSVNVGDNPETKVRAGRLTITAGNAEPVSISISQDAAEEVVPFLNVTPSEPISFSAEAGEVAALTIETNMGEWNYKVPEWLTAEKQEGQLLLTTQANEGTASRVGRVDISAEGAKPVRINVSQNAPDLESVKASLSDAQGGQSGELVIANLNTLELPLSVNLDKSTGNDAQLDIVYDKDYVTAYNLINNTDYQAYPEHLITIPSEGRVTVAAGETSASLIVKINPDDINSLRNGITYLIPVIVKPVAGTGVTAPMANARVNYTISRKCKKEVRNVVYIDTKDTNPLNFLELRLEDGSMMVDAVVLFSSNINWDGLNQEVILNNNGPTQDLLDNNETFLQPLRKAGIKVFLSLLGNHDGAGLANLSEYGAKEYAKTLANAVLKYKLDGVAYDDEYSSYGTLSGEWFEYASPANAARLIYETKEAMKKIVPWETYNMVYYLGNIHSGMPRYNGIAPGQFVDLAVNDYIAGAASPMLGMTKSQCSGGSVELERGSGFNPGSAESIKTRGYGWMMWFSYNPVRHPDNVKAFQKAALGLYDNMKLPDPQYVYKKYNMGSDKKGQFDTEKHPFSWTGTEL